MPLEPFTPACVCGFIQLSDKTRGKIPPPRVERNWVDEWVELFKNVKSLYNT